MKPYSERPVCEHAPDWHRLFDDLYPMIRRVAGVRAAMVARMCGLSYDERADLEQDAALEAWRKLSVFDSSRSSIRTFVERIISNQMASAVRRLRAQRRQAPAYNRTTLRYADCEAGNVDLRVDVLRVLNILRPEQRDVCLMLAVHSPTEISRRAGISRTTIHRMISHLRIAFTDAGLGHAPSHIGAGRTLKSPKSSMGFRAVA
jgi:RNA polymerase sigma factor (sigma-70 family)